MMGCRMKRPILCLLWIVLAFGLTSACMSMPYPTLSTYFRMSLEKTFPDESARRLADAAANNQLEEIDRLLREGVSVDARGKYGLTPLFWAFRSQAKAGFNRLLEASPDLSLVLGEYPPEYGGTIVHHAAKAKDPFYLNAIITHGGDISGLDAKGYNALFAAIEVDNKHTLLMLIKAGIDVNQVGVNKISPDGDSGTTPLLFALEGGQDNDLAYILLQNGANPALLDDAAVILVIDKREIGVFDFGQEQWFEKIENVLRTQYGYTLQCEKKHVKHKFGKEWDYCVRAIKK